MICAYRVFKGSFSMVMHLLSLHADQNGCVNLPCSLQVIQQINLATQMRTNSYNYSTFLPDPTICTGTHSIGYSNISRQCARHYWAVVMLPSAGKGAGCLS